MLVMVVVVVVGSSGTSLTAPNWWTRSSCGGWSDLPCAPLLPWVSATACSDVWL